MKFFKFFTPEDFRNEIMPNGWISCNDATKCANAKLEREGIKAWIYKSKIGEILNITSIEGYRSDLYADSALLINIEPIEKCKHPKEKVKLSQIFTIRNNTQHGGPMEEYKCECGARVQPASFEDDTTVQSLNT